MTVKCELYTNKLCFPLLDNLYIKRKRQEHTNMIGETERV